MPNESREERCIQYVEGRLGLIEPANGFWNSVGLVLGYHPTIEELDGAKSVIASVAPGIYGVDPERRKAGKDTAVFDITIRMHKKTKESLTPRDKRIEVSRMVRDVMLAIYYGKAGNESDLGMNCNSLTAWISAINRQIETGIGWLTCELTLTVEAYMVFTDP